MFNRATGGFIIAMALGITTTVPLGTVDSGMEVSLVLQVTEEKGDIGCHGAFVRDDNVEFDVFVFTNPSLTHDCAAVDKDVFVRVIAADETVAPLHVQPLLGPRHPLRNNYCRLGRVSVILISRCLGLFPSGATLPDVR